MRIWPRKISLRTALEIVALLCFVVAGSIWIIRLTSPPPPLGATLAPDSQTQLTEARYYQQLGGNAVQCQLCFRGCVIPDGGRGFCLARQNVGGKLYTLTYGKPVAVHIDPVEKLPLFHFEPGSDTLCLGTATCNLRCLNCINWNIAQKAPEEVEAVSMSPEEVVRTAVEHGVHTICFTYNEPTQAYEFVYDTSRLAKEQGLRVLIHSNGEMNPEPLKALLPYLDGVAIDLKAFDPDVYRELTTGDLSRVLKNLKLVKQEGVWLEIVCLVVPTWSDDLADIEQMCVWIRDNLGPDVPVHFLRFFPTAKLESLPPTPLSTLEQAHDVALRVGLHYAYIGNVSGHQYTSTYCPSCGARLVYRKGLSIQEFSILDQECEFCGHEIAGAWD